MTTFTEIKGKTVDDAIAAGLAQLGLTRDEVSVEILEREKKSFLGLRSTPAVVKLSYEVPDPEPVRQAPKEAPAAVKAPVEKPSAEKPAAEKPRSPEARKKPQPKAAPKKQNPPEAAAAPVAPSAPSAPAAAEAPAQPRDDAEVVARVEAYLRQLLELMGIQAEITTSRRENGGLNVNLSGSGMGAVIGRRGETLDAIQHLVNYSINRGGEKRMHISVDAENYRSKREDSLVRLAHKMAAKAIKYRRSMALEPMNSYERHVIHTALQDYEGVSTASVGVEPNRRVVVNYERGSAAAASSGSGKPQSREWA